MSDMQVEWTDSSDSFKVKTREFKITRPGKRDITGALWLPLKGQVGSTLICCGHGASGDRYQAPISYLAGRFITEAQVPVLSIDGPVHGLRQVGDGARGSFFPEFQRAETIEDMLEDWRLAIEAVQDLEQMTVSSLAYFGLSMGSIYGVPFVASRADISVAVLGLLGVADTLPHGQTILEAAAKISCPLLFIMQLEDELFDREGYLKLFDQFASVDKRIHANPGLHPEVPLEEVDFAFDFLLQHIQGKQERRIVNPLAE